MQRAIPVFRALIASDADKSFHRNHGELGFALKDLDDPRWQEALEALSEAIRRRGMPRAGFLWYEYNRVLCLINLEGSSRAPDGLEQLIMDDLRSLIRSPMVLNKLRSEGIVADWLADHAVDPSTLHWAGQPEHLRS